MFIKGMTMARWVSRGLFVLVGCILNATISMAKPANLDKEHIPGQLIVKFKPSFDFTAQSQFLGSMGAHALHTFKSNGAQLIEFYEEPTEAMLIDRAASLLESPEVEYVEANTILRAYEVLPNDPRFGDLYGLKNTGSGGGIAGADIKATEAWEKTTGSSKVLVGIIDTGVDYNHPDIKPNYWTNSGETGVDANGKDKASNGIDDDHNGYIDDFRGWNFVDGNNNPMDDNEHGTHVAGTIGARGNDGVGVVGVNWNVSIVGIKFLDASGSGSLADATKAIEYGTALGVTMTSNSWGGGGFSETMKAAIQAANAKGVLFIAAAGNDGVNNDNSPHYPSSYNLDNVIAVAATDNRDQLAGFSCYGLSSVHLAAPGVNIVSSIPSGGYTRLSGTSMATPHVSGAAALIKAAYPNATAAEIKSRLVNTADLVPALTGKTISGGRLNVAAALVDDPYPPTAVDDLAVNAAGITTVKLTWIAAQDEGTKAPAKRYEVRFSDRPILTEDDWKAARRVSHRQNMTSSSVVTAEISGLGLNSHGYAAVKAVNLIGIVGPISESIAYATQPVKAVYFNDAKNLDKVKTEGNWNLATDPSKNKKVFASNSIDSKYKENTNAALTLDPVVVKGGKALLTFDTWNEIEKGFDFGYVEVSKDGSTWQLVDKISGQSAWTTKMYDVSEFLAGGESLQVRFRLVSDYSVNAAGWRLDQIAVYAPQATLD
ncbi:MAG: hypothetical protein FJ146_04875 [Deltaproteobacteria bacterium]|nr:hypothetical protein [Deltaproteobacteria bacterium]